MPKRYIRYFLLLLLIALTLVLINVISWSISAYLPQVSIVRPRQVVFSQTVSAEGSVEGAGSQEITADTPFVAKEVRVREGDTVRENTVIAVVDKAATVKKLREQLLQNSELAESLSQYGGQAASFSEGDLPDQILAGREGRVGELALFAGELILPGERICTMQGTPQYTVKVGIREQDISQVVVGQAASVTGAAFGGRSYAGVVSHIADSAKKQYSGATQETVVEVTVDITDPDSRLKSGYTTRVRIETEAPREISILPYDAILQDDAQNEYVYLYTNGLAHKQLVRTGIETAEGIQVETGLEPGSYVIYNCANVPKDNAFVRVRGKVN